MLQFDSLRTLPLRVVGRIWRQNVRPYLPTKRMASYAGVASSADWKWFDEVLPRNFRPDDVEDIPGYEEKLVAGLKKYVKTGDRVVIVGGGGGITAVLAAKLSGSSGQVICFEAAVEQLPVIKESCRRNGVLDQVNIRYAAIGQAIGVYGHHGAEAPVLSADALPECDVLELDCEGAESVVLDQMVICPPVIIVETHGLYNAPTVDIRDKLSRLGYKITDHGAAEPRLEQWCLEQDIRVLTAVR